MIQTLRTLALTVSAFVLFVFILFVVSQTAQVVDLAARLSPAFGTAVLWFLIAVYSLFLLSAVVFYLRMPAPLIPPESEMEPAFSRHLAGLRHRLSRNARLKAHDLSTRAGLEKGLEDLNRECDAIIRDTASAVFISTAISQSGRLDTFLVLASHFRMMWRIARVYYQRPSLRDMVHLYANVAATAFVAGELDESEISEQIEPVLSSALGALSLSVPGMQAAATIIVTSVLTGAVNAFLTLRVGIIARRYCSCLVLSDRRLLRRSATAEAAGLIGGIVRSGTARLTRALWSASKEKVGGAFSGLTGLARDVKDSLLCLMQRRKAGE